VADAEQLALLKQGTEAWNRWRLAQPQVRPDLTEADLRGTDLTEIDLHEALLVRADLSGSKLRHANLADANLHEALLVRADLSGSLLERADLSGSRLERADLSETDLNSANLDKTNLTGAVLLNADLRGASILDAIVFGVSIWNVRTDGAQQMNLIITPPNESPVTVDNLEVAQFIYLILNNQKIRNVIDSISLKSVLVLGRFTDERRLILDTLRDELRKRDYVPIVFDFDRPSSRSTMETVSVLALTARFIIIDLTNAEALSRELARVIPNVVVPVVPLIGDSSQYAMFQDFVRYPWVLPTQRYDSPAMFAQMIPELLMSAEHSAMALETRKKPSTVLSANPPES
jgi:Pentapeptide repeats (8 copies)